MKNEMHIKSVHNRRILNSHGDFTNEFVIFLRDGSIGRGASPKGESISIYEDTHIDISPKKIIEELKKDGIFNKAMSQEDFDSYLEGKMGIFGRNNSYALSLAFYDSHEHFMQVATVEDRHIDSLHIPLMSLNILNGGNHAYTNPVESEFQEYMLIAKKNDLLAVISDHELIQRSVKEKLAKRDKIYVNNNLVNKSDHGDSRDWFDFLQAILKELGLESDYDQMIDASAGDLWTGKGYEFAITDRSLKTSKEMCTYWLDVIKNHNLTILEDPFHETDFESWQTLTGSQGKCRIVGDNLYSGDAERIAEGIKKGYAHGIILKPNQAGTVTNTIEAIKLVQKHNQTLITSHRSISTESTFLSHISNRYNAEYIKIGPILTDYSSVLRINEFIRLTGLGYE
jgi:enolase